MGNSTVCLSDFSIRTYVNSVLFLQYTAHAYKSQRIMFTCVMVVVVAALNKNKCIFIRLV